MTTTTTVSDDTFADLQDVLYSFKHGARANSMSDQATEALLPIIEAHTIAVRAAELRNLADQIEAGDLDAVVALRERADALNA